MASRHARRLVVLLTCALALCACGPPAPTPLPDAGATEDALGAAVEATLTALAPTAAPAREPTATPRPRPTATATRTASPVVESEGWLTYTSVAGTFSLAYPPTWTIDDEDGEGVDWEAPRYAAAFVGIFEAGCGLSSFTGFSEQALNCLAAGIADAADARSADASFRLLGKSEWDDGVHRGYVIESTLYSKPREVYTTFIDVFLPLPDGDVLAAYYFRVGTKILTESERAAFTEVVRSVRVHGR